MLFLKFFSILKRSNGKIYRLITFLTPSWLVVQAHKILGDYPAIVGKEAINVKKILFGTQWNMSQGNSQIHIQLEEEICSYTGANFAISVNGGGMALMMSLRALGLSRGDEVLHQIDTCSAVPFSVLNAQYVPRFVDSSANTFTMDLNSLQQNLTKKSKAIIATHLWGNSENMEELSKFSLKNNLFLIEDSCLAFGTKYKKEHVGNIGKVGIFSFGSSKPIQAGEGGVIVTQDEELAKELRAMRHWGERTHDFGNRDVHELSWNGRLPEVIASIAIEQVKHYPERLLKIQENVRKFEVFLQRFPFLKIVKGFCETINDSSFSQVILKYDYQDLKSELSIEEIRSKLTSSGIGVFYANFEPISTLTFFHSNKWRDWIPESSDNLQLINPNIEFPGAYEIYQKSGLSISRRHFSSRVRYREFEKAFNGCIRDLLKKQ